MMQRGFTRKRGTTWTAYFKVSDGAGWRQRSKGGFRTKAEANAWLTETLAAQQRGELIEPSRLTVGEYLLDRWLPLMEHSLRPSTFDSYTRMIERHVLPSIGNLALQELRPDHLDALYARLLKSGHHTGTKGLSPKTIRYLHTTIQKALRDAVRKGLVLRNVAEAADPPRSMRRTEMHTWTASELKSFLNDMEGHRLYAAYLLAATTGMRRGEVLGLRWRDIDFESSRLAVRQTIVSVNYKIVINDPKTDRGRRSIALDPVTVKALQVRRSEQAREEGVVELSTSHDLVFTKVDGAPIHPDYFSQLFDRTVARLKLPKIRLHDLRHTHATLGLAARVPVKIISDRLGHATTAFTQDTYIHAIPQDEADSADKIANLIFGSESVYGEDPAAPS